MYSSVENRLVYCWHKFFSGIFREVGIGDRARKAELINVCGKTLAVLSVRKGDVTMRTYPTLQEKIISLFVLLAMILFSATGCAIAQPVSAAGETTPAMDYKSAYHELLVEHNALLTAYNEMLLNREPGSTDFQSQIDELNQALKQAQEELARARAERDQAIAESEALREQCSIRYIVQFELIRRNILTCETESVFFTASMTAAEFARFQVGTEVENASPYLSRPTTSSPLAEWTIRVHNAYPERISTEP